MQTAYAAFDKTNEKITLKYDTTFERGVSLSNLAIGTTTPSAKLHLVQNGTGDAFRVDDVTNDTTPFIITDTGNVGVGTNTPLTNFHVNGDIFTGTNGANIATYRNTLTGNVSGTSKFTFVGSTRGNTFKCIVTSSREAGAEDRYMVYEEFEVVWHGMTTPVILNRKYENQTTSGARIFYPAVFYYNSATNIFTIEHSRISSGFTAYAEVVMIGNLLSKPTITFDTNIPPGVRITETNGVNSISGNVGIGCITPAGKLDVFTPTTLSNLEFPPVRMTADTSTITGQFYGNGTFVASVSSRFNNSATFSSWKVFNKTNIDGNDSWCSLANTYDGTTGEYIYNPQALTGTYAGEWTEIALPTPMIVKSFSIQARNAAAGRGDPNEFAFFGSTDDITWTQIGNEYTGVTFTQNSVNTYTVTNTTAYSYYRIAVKKVIYSTTASYVSIGEWRLYGTPTEGTTALQIRDQNAYIAPYGETQIGTVWMSDLNKRAKESYATANNAVSTWISRTSAIDNQWLAMCWSAELSLFCAVAYSGTSTRVMTSPNGINWTARTAAADNQWISICWAAELSLFCAVAISGTSNRVMTSPDGITWTARTTAVNNFWRSVCWAAELSIFCAVAITGTGNRVMTSPDGITWTTRTSAVDNEWFSVCWSPELSLFCAVANTGTGNRVMTSPDGINWTARTSAADNQWRSVCWSPQLSLFCAVAITGTGNRVMTSPDGITWTARTSAVDNQWRYVCWSPELSIFCAVADSGVNNRIMTSAIAAPAPKSTLLVSPAHMTVNQVNGNVGIGTATPKQKVNILGNSLIENTVSYTTAIYPPVALTNNTTVLAEQIYGNGTWIASASTIEGEPYNAFSKTRITIWSSSDNTYLPNSGGVHNTALFPSNVTNGYAGEWLQLQFPTSVKINAYRLSASYPKNFKLFGSTNGSTWTELHEATNQTTNNDYTPTTYNIASPNFYSYYRFVVNTINAPTSTYIKVVINELEFVGDVIANYPLIQTNGDKVVIQQSQGNVGIGTTTPLSTLHINGDVRADTKIKTPFLVGGYEINGEAYASGQHNISLIPPAYSSTRQLEVGLYEITVFLDSIGGSSPSKPDGFIKAIFAVGGNYPDTPDKSYAYHGAQALASKNITLSSNSSPSLNTSHLYIGSNFTFGTNFIILYVNHQYAFNVYSSVMKIAGRPYPFYDLGVTSPPEDARTQKS